MAKNFFTTKEASEITGCSLRQLQYWRDKAIVSPQISASGSGRSVYYFEPELVELAVMNRLLLIGLTPGVAGSVLELIRDKAPNFASTQTQLRFMLIEDEEERLIKLEEFSQEKAIALVEEGKVVVPLWLDCIHQQLQSQLQNYVRDDN